MRARLAMGVGLVLALVVVAGCAWVGESPSHRTQSDADWHSTRLEGQVQAGERFSRSFGPGLELCLDPIQHGWEICVRAAGSSVNLARLTPPFHFVPNPREIEGWHFRNSDNTGPNEKGPKNVNAPQEEREFIFSPHVTAETPVRHEEVLRTREEGKGVLTIKSYELTPVKEGDRATMLEMTFEVELQWR